MFVRIGVAEDTDVEAQKNIALSVVAAACRALKSQIRELATSWKAL